MLTSNALACPPHLHPQLLERREKEAAGSDARARNDRLRYGARLYRLLGAVLLAATPLVPLPPAATPAGPALASTVEQLRRLAHRMAMLAVGSCLAVHREFVAQRAARAAAGRGGLAALDVEEDLGSELLSLGDVRQRLQVWGEAAAAATSRGCRGPLHAGAVSPAPLSTLHLCNTSLPAGPAVWPAGRAVGGAAGVGRAGRVPEHAAPAQACGGCGVLRPGAVLRWVALQQELHAPEHYPIV